MIYIVMLIAYQYVTVDLHDGISRSCRHACFGPLNSLQVYCS